MPPKARMILELLEEYEPPLTADWQRFYHGRLTDAVLYLDNTEFVHMTNWLPADSAFVVCAQAKGDFSKARELMGWTNSDDLTVMLMNLIQHQTYVIAKVGGDKKSKPPKEIKNPRGLTPSRGAGGDASAMARALMAQQKG